MIFDGEWTRRMGACWPGTNKNCIHVSREESPILLSDMRSLSMSAAPSVHVLRRATRSSGLSSSAGLGEFSEHALAVGTAASFAVAIVGVIRASEVAQFLASDSIAGPESGLANVRAARQKKDSAVVGQLACLVAAPACSGAFPVRMIDD